MSVKITQAFLEWMGFRPTDLQLTQENVEVASFPPNELIVTQMCVEVAYLPYVPPPPPPPGGERHTKYGVCAVFPDSEIVPDLFAVREPFESDGYPAPSPPPPVPD